MKAPHRRPGSVRRRPWSTLGLLALIALVAAATARAATTISEADRAAVRRVIEEQISAFKRNDAPSAFSYAAPALQTLFGTPDRFLLMVRENYAPIYRPRAVKFGDLEIVGGEFTQTVTVIGEDGTAAVAYYMMTRQKDGSWRISGCILIPAEKQEA